ncbi:MAG: hypothetical protein K5649_05565 [Lachnospiraceae bacterium]|nr:hypothetical protein [Lachnospiraceae bacterium]
MEAYVIIGVIVLLLLIFYVTGRVSEHHRNQILRAALLESFGKLPDTEYQASDLERIGKYHAKMADQIPPGHFCIDDTTWNDLNMNDVFAKFNATQSSVGEEYLFHRMHLMSLAEETHFAGLTDYFGEHEDERLKTQIILHKLGRIRQFSITDILGYAYDLEPERNLKHYLLDIGLILSVILIFFSSGIGVTALLILLAYSILSYYKRKGEITPYFTTFMYIIRMLTAAESIASNKDSVMERDAETLSEIIAKCRHFKKNAFFLTSGTQFTENIFDILFDYIRIIFHIDIIKFNSMLQFLKEHTENIELLRTVLGRIDASIAVSSTMKAIPHLTRPEFTEEKELAVTDGIHPLLTDPVPNSVTASGGVLITGSNASGKSTFIKTIALCALLSQTLSVVPAKAYRACRVRLVTSMALSDQITQHESYFMVEIKSLKRIVDLAKEDGAPVLCFVDEVLRGTNTVERIAASSRILSNLNKTNAICFAATHDIELTHILENEFTNYHFEEEISGGDVIFNYRLQDGRSHTQNAIMLLSVIGFDQETIRNAKEAATHFVRTNQWEVLGSTT